MEAGGAAALARSGTINVLRQGGKSPDFEKHPGVGPCLPVPAVAEIQPYPEGNGGERRLPAGKGGRPCGCGEQELLPAAVVRNGISCNCGPESYGKC